MLPLIILANSNSCWTSESQLEAIDEIRLDWIIITEIYLGNSIVLIVVVLSYSSLLKMQRESDSGKEGKIT